MEEFKFEHCPKCGEKLIGNINYNLYICSENLNILKK